MSEQGGRPVAPSEDNVIYLNFGARRRVATDAEASHAEQVVPVERYSQAAMRVLNAALRRTDPGRAKRGQQYATKGHVHDLNVRMNGIEAYVTGSQNEPFFTGFRLPPRDPQELQRAVSQIAARPGSVKLAQRGEFPDEVLNVLLAHAPEEFRFFCDCPDGVDVCKHSVAVAAEAAKRIDADPELVFTLRGMSMDTVDASIRDGAYALARENAEAGSEFFWSGREMPELPRPKTAPMVDDSDTDMLRRALEPVSFTNIDLLNAVADIEDLYDMLVDPDS